MRTSLFFLIVVGTVTVTLGMTRGEAFCRDCWDSNMDTYQEDPDLLCEISEGKQHNFVMEPGFIGGWSGWNHPEHDCGLCEEAGHEYSRFKSCGGSESALDLFDTIKQRLSNGQGIDDVVASERVRFDSDELGLEFIGCEGRIVAFLPITSGLAEDLRYGSD